MTPLHHRLKVKARGPCKECQGNFKSKFPWQVFCSSRCRFRQEKRKARERAKARPPQGKKCRICTRSDKQAQFRKPDICASCDRARYRNPRHSCGSAVYHWGCVKCDATVKDPKGVLTILICKDTGRERQIDCPPNGRPGGRAFTAEEIDDRLAVREVALKTWIASTVGLRHA